MVLLIIIPSWKMAISLGILTQHFQTKPYVLLRMNIQLSPAIGSSGDPNGHPRGEYHKRKSSKSRSKLFCGTYLRQLRLPTATPRVARGAANSQCGSQFWDWFMKNEGRPPPTCGLVSPYCWGWWWLGLVNAGNLKKEVPWRTFTMKGWPNTRPSYWTPRGGALPNLNFGVTLWIGP